MKYVTQSHPQDIDYILRRNVIHCCFQIFMLFNFNYILFISVQIQRKSLDLNVQSASAPSRGKTLPTPVQTKPAHCTLMKIYCSFHARAFNNLA